MKRALLFSAKPGILKGVSANLDRMREVLAWHGFHESNVLVHEHATLATIRRELDAMVASNEAGDILVVYFTGHGGVLRFASDGNSLGQDPEIWHYLRTEDDELDSRALLNVELHDRLRAATQEGASVTLILECCFAGGMLKPAESYLRARGAARGNLRIQEGIPVPPRLDSLLIHARTRLRSPTKRLVLITASAELYQAYERPVDPVGYFSEALHQVLLRRRGQVSSDEVITWDEVIDEIQLWFRGRSEVAGQLPQLVGPRGQEVFGHRVVERASFMVEREAERVWIVGGALQGVAKGDCVALYDREEALLGQATIDMVDFDRARLGAIEAAAVSSLTRSVVVETTRRVGVMLAINDAPAQALRQALKRSTWLRVVDNPDHGDLRVTAGADGLEVITPTGVRRSLSEGLGDEPERVAVECLEQLARRQWLEAIVTGLEQPPEPLEFEIEVRKGGGNEGEWRGLEARERVQLGVDQLRCRMRYEGGCGGRTWFAYVLRADVGGALRLDPHWHHAASGVNLVSEYEDKGLGRLESIELDWPLGVPRTPQAEQIWVLVTSRPIDLRALMSPLARGRGAGGTELGGVRLHDRVLALRCYLRRFEYVLEPGRGQWKGSPWSWAQRQRQRMGRRRALLIGATLGRLSGMAHDVDAIARALEQHGFRPEDQTSLVPARADDIRAGLDKLVEETEPGDVALIYYSGHGVELRRELAGSRVATMEENFFRFLPGSDFFESCDTHFRGLTSIELSLALADLETENIIVMLDCCHAGQVVRAKATPGSVPAGERPPTTERHHIARALELTPELESYAGAHFDRLQRYGFAEDRREVDAHPHAVRLLACESSQQAYELVDGDRAHGLFTRAICEVLEHAPDDMTWQELAIDLASTSVRWYQRQRPTVDGPYRRYLFETSERAQAPLIEVRGTGGLSLAGGALGGVGIGDVYDIVAQGPVGASAWGRSHLGVARVEELTPTVARLEPAQVRPKGATSCWARLRLPQRPRVRLDCEGLEAGSAGARRLSAHFERHGLVSLDAASDELPLIGRIVVADGKIQLWSSNHPFGRPRVFRPEGSPTRAALLAETLAVNAQKLARWNLLDRLSELSSTLSLDPDWNWSLSFGCVAAGGTPRTLDGGETLEWGSALFVEVENLGPKIYLTGFLMRPELRIDHISRARGTGVEIAKGGRYTLGQAPGGALRGHELRKPSASQVPLSQRVRATLVVIITDQPVDLRAWVESHGFELPTSEDPRESSTIRASESTKQSVGEARFAIHRCNLWLQT